MRSRPATLRLPVCLLAAVVVLLMDAKAATASCGDYVHVRTPGQKADPTHDQSVPADSPCAHGKCDRAPLTPAAPEPTAPTSGGSAQDAVLAACVVTPPPAAFGYNAVEDSVPSFVSSAPFHPPRA